MCHFRCEVKWYEWPAILTKKELTGVYCPIIMMSGFADIEMAVESMQQGAAHFFTKPVRNQALIDCVFTQLKLKAEKDKYNKDKRDYFELNARLSAREKEVFCLIVQGDLSKVIASKLGLSKNTVDVHRCNIMKKMKIRTLGKLVADAVYFEVFNEVPVVIH